MEAIVLAGGRGTRLAGVLGDLPKPMAPVAGQPFLARLLGYLAASGVAKVALSTGYRHESIESFFGTHFAGMSIDYCREAQPLGTGGALRQALAGISGEHALILNGDTFLRVDYRKMLTAHVAKGCAVTIAVKPMPSCDRYGAVTLAGDRVVGFEEKGRREAGCINAGVYCVKRDLFAAWEPPAASFSFEDDFLARRLEALKVCAFVADGYFIDIGVPEDYARAQQELGEELEKP